MGPNGSTKVLQGHRCRTQHRGSGCLIGFIDFLHPAYPFAFGLLSRGTALQNFRLLLPEWGLLDTKERAAAACQELIQALWLREVSRPRGVHNGRPSTQYEVNPKIVKRTRQN